MKLEFGRTQTFMSSWFVGAWAMTSDGLLVLLLVVSTVRAFDSTAPSIGDRGALGQFVFLVLALAAVFHFARV